MSRYKRMRGPTPSHGQGLDAHNQGMGLASAVGGPMKGLDIPGANPLPGRGQSNKDPQGLATLFMIASSRAERTRRTRPPGEPPSTHRGVPSRYARLV